MTKPHTHTHALTNVITLTLELLAPRLNVVSLHDVLDPHTRSREEHDAWLAVPRGLGPGLGVKLGTLGLGDRHRKVDGLLVHVLGLALLLLFLLLLATASATEIGVVPLGAV